MAELIELLKFMIDKGASDLHITTGTNPRFRLAGKLITNRGLSHTDPRRHQGALLQLYERVADEEIRGY